jgi:ribosomal protein S5
LWRGRCTVAKGKYFGFPAARARGGRGGRVGIGRNLEALLQFAYFSGFKLEGGIAMVADVVEAAFRLAGIEDVG